MQTRAVFSQANKAKTNFNDIYVSEDPRQYFSYLGELDYIIPHLAQPVFDQLIRARASSQVEPVTVLDLGCSYGVNGALMKYALGYDMLRERYTSPSFQGLGSQDLLELDRAFYRSWPRHAGVRVVGLDVSENAIRYARQCGAIDAGFAIDLEASDPEPEAAEVLSRVDLIVSTGCVGYVTNRTFERLALLSRRGRPAWVASFVLRMFSYEKIAETLAGHGLQTEKFEGATFVQRRFSSREEMNSAIAAVERNGVDTRGRETEGLYHADLYVSRPADEIERQPIQKLVNVVSGANKPWTIGTNVLGRHGETARERAVAGQRFVTAAPES